MQARLCLGEAALRRAAGARGDLGDFGDVVAGIRCCWQVPTDLAIVRWHDVRDIPGIYLILCYIPQYIEYASYSDVISMVSTSI